MGAPNFGTDDDDTFKLARGDGSDIITDFGAGDRVQLDDYGFTSIAEVRAALSQVGADTYLRLSATETLVFRNTLATSLTDDQFVLPSKPTLSLDPIRWFHDLTGVSQYFGTTANDTFELQSGVAAGGLGDDQYSLVPGVTVVEKAGEGIDTGHAWTSTSVIPDNVENLIMHVPGTGTGNGLGNYIEGSSGADVINGKGGNDYLFGGAGNDTFVFEKASGSDTIMDFHAAGSGGEHDILQLSGYGKDAYATIEDEKLIVHYVGGTDVLTLTGVHNLSSTDFLFI